MKITIDNIISRWYLFWNDLSTLVFITLLYQGEFSFSLYVFF